MNRRPNVTRREVITGALAAGAFEVFVPRVIRAQSAEKIRLITIAHDSLTPIYYGLQHGHFQRAGIDLEIITASSGAVSTQAVVAGTYELGNSSLLATMAAHLRGIEVAIVAPNSIYTPKNPATLLQVAMDSTAKTGADLNGKIVAASALHDLSELSIRSWVDKTGGDAKSLQFVEVPNSATEAALAEHRVAAGIINEPLLDISIQAGKTKTLGDALGTIAPTFMYAGFIARLEWAHQNADLVRRFTRVMGGLASYTNVHPSETVEMMAEVTKVPVPVMQKVRRVLCATRLDPAMVQPLIDAAAKYQQIARGFPAQEIFFK
jgi:NitT/TauT family transport system substrate-binding protein